jgi:hypothetical protein
MSRSNSRRVGAGVLTRYRDGSCNFACHHSGCHAYSQPRGWRAGLRLARQHAAAHDQTEAGDVGTPWGVPTHELPPTIRRRRPLRRLAAAVVVLALAALAFTLTLTGVTGHAAPRPTPAAPSIAILPTTTAAAAGPESEGYVPTPAGPPATDAGGQWIPEPAPTPPGNSSAGGGR